AEQHAPAGVERDLRLDRQQAPRLGLRTSDTRDGRTHFENVLAGLDQQQIDTAREQRDRLLAIQLGKLLVGDVTERGIVRRRQHAGWPYGAGNEPWPLRGAELIGDLPREPSGGGVDLMRALTEYIVIQLEACASEGVGLHHVGSGGEVGAVDAADGIRPG